MKRRASLLITDLDDTIWYWFKVWHAAFRAELDELKKETGIPEAILIPQIKKVHERHHTSEYAFMLQELPCLQEIYGKDFNPKQTLPEVIKAYRKARKANTGLYPTVLKTLKEIKKTGARIIAFTESQRYYSIQRLKVCGLDGIVDVLYATEESKHVSPSLLASSREHDKSWYSLKKTKLVTLPLGLKKPNPRVLRDILKSERSCPQDAVYIGDTLSKDIVMAIDAGVPAAHARYGETHRQPGYALLKKVTHWRKSDVVAQVKAAPKPDMILNRDFRQILDHVDFQKIIIP